MTSQPGQLRRAGSSERELSADFYRASAVVLIVIGHWLAASVTFRDGHFANDNALVMVPWTQWLTWIFQVVPIFFLVAGYANAGSWARWSLTGRGAADWYRHRLSAVLGPTTVYVAAVLMVVFALIRFRVNGSQIAFATWAVAMHLWFIPVYVLVVALTPCAVRAHTRWGLRVLAAFAVAVAVIDIGSRWAGATSTVGWVNYVLCWAAIYQLGIAWHYRSLSRRQSVFTAGASAAVLAALLWRHLYPVSMVGVTGQNIQNTSPPTLAMLTFAVAQCAVAIAIAPALSRWLARSRVKTLVQIAGQHVMGLYLWHMIPVVLVALVVYPSGLFPQPVTGSAYWWWSRLLWVAILTTVTVLEMVLIGWGRSLFNWKLSRVPVQLPAALAAPMLSIGVVLIVVALWHFAAHGFAAGGHFPVPAAVLYSLGVLLIVVTPSRAS